MRQAQALTIMMGGANMFLTGAPGAGKTYLLNQFVELARQSGKRVAVTASTGIAATHIGGTTIHSWSGTGIKDSLNARDLQILGGSNKLIKRYNSTDILVIDEVSMLHGKRLDMLNTLAKLLRQSRDAFGGLQVILVGDMFQLPPVSRSDDLGAQRAADGFDFAYTAETWQELNLRVCYLTEQHRQSGTDGLLELLIAMRRGEVEQEHYNLLQDRLGHPSKTDITRLYAHNVDVDQINQEKLNSINGAPQSYTMLTNGRAAKVEQLVKGVLAPAELELKIDAQVMFVANDFNKGFVNGSRGRVVDFKNGWPVVELAGSQRKLVVEPHSWTREEDGRKVAEVAQLPLRLAWAITIHKSQGMSLDAAQIDLGKTFMPGMGYVALSRIRSLEGIYLLGINNMAMNMHQEIYEFDNAISQASAKLATKTPDFVVLEVSAPAEKPVDKLLLQQLKEWRLARAKTDQVSAFIVAHNSLLEAIATSQPQTVPQLLGLPGFGAGKLEKYGPDILEIVSKNQGKI